MEKKDFYKHAKYSLHRESTSVSASSHNLILPSIYGMFPVGTRKYCTKNYWTASCTSNPDSASVRIMYIAPFAYRNRQMDCSKHHLCSLLEGRLHSGLSWPPRREWHFAWPMVRNEDPLTVPFAVETPTSASTTDINCRWRQRNDKKHLYVPRWDVGILPNHGNFSDQYCYRIEIMMHLNSFFSLLKVVL